MLNLKKLGVKVTTGIIAIAIAMMNFCWVLPAAAVTQKLQIISDRGYTITTAFDYDRESSKVMSEQGKGKTKAIDSLTVSFYSPEGKMLGSYDNIIHGVAQGDYFEFNYDPMTHQLLGAIDLGGESAGEIYLKGDAEEGLQLIRVEPSGEEIIMEDGQWTIDR